MISILKRILLLLQSNILLMIAWKRSVTSFAPRFCVRGLKNNFRQPKVLFMSSILGKALVSVDEALEATSNVKFVDGSWWLGNARNAQQEYEAGPRIAGASFFDLDAIATTGEQNPKNLPHMAPPKELFAAAMDAMGIDNTHHVIVYGTEGCMFIPRTYYTFKAMGHDPTKVHLMQGSLQEWIARGGPIDTHPTSALDVSTLDTTKPTNYQAQDAQGFCAMDQLAQNQSDAIVVDARSAGRFVGTEPEPRPGLRGGHIPGSFNLPFTQVLQEEDKTKFKDPQQLAQVFQDAGVDIHTPKTIVCTCGSGVTAAAIAVALEQCGRDTSKTVVFDGSWIEWASDLSNPVDKQPSYNS